MSENTINHQEEPAILTLHPHPIIAWLHGLYIGLFILSLVFFWSIHTILISLVGAQLFWAILSLYCIVCILVIFFSWIQYSGNILTLTANKITCISYRHIFSKHSSECGLENVQEVQSIISGILPSLFGYGTIRVSTASNTSHIIFPFTPNPDKHIQVIHTTIQKYREAKTQI